MTAQLEMFAPSPIGQDLTRARRERDKGIKKVADNNALFIPTMCGIARLLARTKKQITADDLREEAARRGLEPTHFNCWGALCASQEWKRDFVCVGFTISKQVRGHGNLIRKWQLKDER